MVIKILLCVFGSLCTLLLLAMIYPLCVYIKLKSNLKKLKSIYMQLVYQVDVKYNLLSLDNNHKDEKLVKLLQEYNSNKDDVIQADLKKYNEAFNSYILKTKNEEMINKCNLAQEKIDYTKEYYNEVVFSFNKYKENKFANYLSKSLSINDAKLY